jgi:hypothetical protein
MIEAMSFLEELEVVVSRGSAESRQRALWHATDLLIAGRYTDDEIWIFGEVIGLLEQDIAVATRAQLANDWPAPTMRLSISSTNLPLTIRLMSQVLCCGNPNDLMTEPWLLLPGPKASYICSQYPSESRLAAT